MTETRSCRCFYWKYRSYCCFLFLHVVEAFHVSCKKKAHSWFVYSVTLSPICISISSAHQPTSGMSQMKEWNKIFYFGLGIWPFHFPMLIYQVSLHLGFPFRFCIRQLIMQFYLSVISKRHFSTFLLFKNGDFIVLNMNYFCLDV